MRLQEFFAFLPLVSAVPAFQRDQPAPLILARGIYAPAVADTYIVKFKQDSKHDDVGEVMTMLDIQASQRYQHLFQGFSAKLNQTTLGALRNLAHVRIKAETLGLHSCVADLPRSTRWSKISYLFECTQGAGESTVGPLAHFSLATEPWVVRV